MYSKFAVNYYTPAPTNVHVQTQSRHADRPLRGQFNSRRRYLDTVFESERYLDPQVRSKIHDNLSVDAPLGKYIQQGFTDYFYAAKSVHSAPIGPLVRTYKVFKDAKKVFLEWLELVKNAVVALFDSAVDALSGWLATIKALITAACSYSGHQIGKLRSFLQALFTASDTDSAEAIHLVDQIEREDRSRAVELNDMYAAKYGRDDIFCGDGRDGQYDQQTDTAEPWYERYPARACQLIEGIVTSLMKFTENFVETFSNERLMKFTRSFNVLTSAWFALGRLDIIGKAGWLVDLIYHAVTGDHLFVKYEVINLFSETTKKLGEALDKAEPLRNPPHSLQSEIGILWEKVVSLYPAVLREDKPNAQFNKTVLESFRSRADRFVGNDLAKRLKPVVLAIRGDSGAGKTWTSDLLVTEIMPLVSKLLSSSPGADLDIFKLHAENPSSLTVACVQDKPEYDEGYRQPLFYLMNELYTPVVLESKMEWSRRFMGLSGSEPQPLNMAFGDKGKKFFQSPFIIATGNFEQHTIGVNDPVAYFRRIELDLIAKTLPYKGKFNVKEHARFFFSSETLPILANPHLCPSPVLHEFVSSNKYLNQGISYKQVLYLMAAIYIDRICYDVMSIEESKVDMNPDVTSLRVGEVRNLSNTYYDRFGHVFSALNLERARDEPEVSPRDACISSTKSTKILELIEEEESQIRFRRKIANVCCRIASWVVSNTCDRHEVVLDNYQTIRTNISSKMWARFIVDNRNYLQCDHVLAAYITLVPGLRGISFAKFRSYVKSASVDDQTLRDALAMWFKATEPVQPPSYLGLVEDSLLSSSSSSSEESPWDTYVQQSVSDVDWFAPVDVGTNDYLTHYYKLCCALADKKQFSAMYVEPADLYLAGKRIQEFCPVQLTSQPFTRFQEDNPWKMYARVTSGQARFYAIANQGLKTRAQITREEFNRIKVELKYLYRVARSIRMVCAEKKKEYDEFVGINQLVPAFTAAFVSFTDRQKQVSRFFVKTNYSRDLNSRGHFTPLSTEVKRKYQDRLHANAKRSSTKNANIRKKRMEDRMEAKSKDAPPEAAHKQAQRDKRRDVLRNKKRAEKRFDQQSFHSFGNVFTSRAKPMTKVIIRTSTDLIEKDFPDKIERYGPDVFLMPLNKVPTRFTNPLALCAKAGWSNMELVNLIRCRMLFDDNHECEDHFASFMCFHLTRINAIPSSRILEGFNALWRKMQMRPDNSTYWFEMFLLALITRSATDVGKLMEGFHFIYQDKLPELQQTVLRTDLNSIIGVLALTGKIEQKFIDNVFEMTVGVKILWSVIGFSLGVTVICGIVQLIVYFLESSGVIAMPSATPPPPNIESLAEQIREAGYEVTFTPIEKVDQQISSKDPEKDAKPRKPHVDEFAKRSKLVARQGVRDDATLKITNNQYALFSNMGTKIGEGLFLGGQLMVLPYHVYASMRCFKAMAFNDQTDYEYNFSMSNVTLVDSDRANDLAVITVKGVQNKASIWKFIMDDDLLVHAGVLENCIISYWSKDPASKANGDLFAVGNVKPVLKPRSIYNNDPVEIEKHGSYVWKGNYAGACGAILISYSSGNPVIAGFHVGGSSIGRCACVFLSKNFIRRIVPNPAQLDKFKAKPALIGLTHTDPVHGMYGFTQQGYVTTMSTVATDSTVYRPTPFTVFDFAGGPPKTPAILTYEAYNLAVEKDKAHDRVLVYSEEAYNMLDECKETVVSKFVPLGVGHIAGCRTLTFDEAMYGYEELGRFDASSSRGLRLKKWGIKKDALFDTDTPADPEAVAFVRERVLELTNAFRDGDYTYQLNVDKLKDELRDHDRVAAKKTRIFNITDFVDNLLIKQAVGDLVSRTKTLFFHGPAACGTNPRGDAWRVLYNRYLGKKVLFADVSGFDSTHTAFFYSAMGLMLELSYNDLDERQFAWWAIISCINGLRFNKCKARLLGRGNTSGNWITTWLNTFVNLCYFCVATGCLASSNGHDPNEVIKELIIDLYSDDNLSSLPYSWYTASAVSKEFDRLFGITLTSVDKGELTDVGGLGTIDDAEFLSRTFLYYEGAVLAPLSRDSLLAQLYYIRIPRKFNGGEAYMMKQLQQNLDNVASELMEWHPDDALSMAKDIIKFIRDHNLRLRFDYQIEVDRIDFKCL